MEDSFGWAAWRGPRAAMKRLRRSGVRGVRLIEGGIGERREQIPRIQVLLLPMLLGSPIKLTSTSSPVQRENRRRCAVGCRALWIVIVVQEPKETNYQHRCFWRSTAAVTKIKFGLSSAVCELRQPEVVVVPVDAVFIHRAVTKPGLLSKRHFLYAFTAVAKND